jgi:hypothetical protein
MRGINRIKRKILFHCPNCDERIDLGRRFIAKPPFPSPGAYSRLTLSRHRLLMQHRDVLLHIAAAFFTAV